MKTCQKEGCKNTIPLKIVIDGKSINLQRRKFCFTCSPFQSHNTRNLNMSQKTSYDNVKAFRQRKKQKAIEYKGGKCQLCGYNRCIRALKFHHRDPSQKDFTISTGNVWGFDRIKSELDKCILLCGNCHDEVHDGLVSV